jgi:hypothetical protein
MKIHGHVDAGRRGSSAHDHDVWADARRREPASNAERLFLMVASAQIALTLMRRPDANDAET